MKMKACLTAAILVWGLLLAAAFPNPAISAAAGEPAQSSDEALWQQFMKWVPSAPIASGPRPLFIGFRDSLIARGASAEEAQRQIAVIRRLYRERPDAWRAVFNNVYQTDTPAFSIQPNALLMSAVENRKPGRALDVGMGQGRNSVFLALKGWDVTGFDVSDVAIAAARKNAEHAGVKVNAIRQSDEAFDYGSAQWDLIVYTYEPLPVTSAAYVERLRKSMKPGAIIVIESFSGNPATSGNAATAINPGELLLAFKEFRLLHFEDTVAIPDWRGTGLKKRGVVRMVAEKRP